MDKVRLNLHMISNSSGETLVSVARASIAQFSNVEVREYVWSLINNEQQIDKIEKYIASHRLSFVMYTMVDDNLREYLKNRCRELKIPCIPVLSRVIREISSYIGIRPNAPKKHYEMLSDDYYSRVDAMNYVLSHDDGQSMWDIDDADIILIGVSRTSKSPTSIYLAYRGYKVFNIPFVSGVDTRIENFAGKLVVGLTIDPIRLIEIRKNRVMGMMSVQRAVSMDYVGIENVTKEVMEAKKMFKMNKWPIVDVTTSSVEEIAARVIQCYSRFKRKKW